MMFRLENEACAGSSSARRAACASGGAAASAARSASRAGVGDGDGDILGLASGRHGRFLQPPRSGTSRRVTTRHGLEVDSNLVTVRDLNPKPQPSTIAKDGKSPAGFGSRATSHAFRTQKVCVENHLPHRPLLARLPLLQQHTIYEDTFRCYSIAMHTSGADAEAREHSDKIILRECAAPAPAPARVRPRGLAASRPRGLATRGRR